MKNNRKCVLCGKEYSYCPNCDRDYLKPNWMVLWCSDVCKDLDEILSEHTHKRLTDAEAKEKLAKINYAGVIVDNEANKKHIEQIMATTSTDKVEVKENPIQKMKGKIKK